jgi:serine/threonine protein kinase/tetratricopeptide (TPR) repeat protein
VSLDAEQALFDACLAADAKRREELLSGSGDATLAARVRRLLAIHDGDAAALDASLESLSPLAMPRQIGPYRVLERLGEGAMGEVFLAEQSEPVRRRVAIKVIKFGLSTRDVIARFELERQALAMLAHPNIARILDAGSTNDGRPYFAMEYVDGTPITRYCEEHGLEMGPRLALFAQVCAGVQHAHLRGIIHRDLKPSNILVADADGKPAPRIIDFGIAKATTSQGMDTLAQTRFGHLLGTPEYMSPEQAQLAPLDVDLRTDVYSLGVVLYELLTGQRPYGVTRGAISRDQLAREIGEGEARRPSDCVTGEWATMIRGDLDWIVLRAIEKDRTRRYSSVQELASDLERHARNEPVLAGPPSVSYRAGRFVRRHKLAVALAASLFVAVLLFGSAMAWLARENARERDRANAEAEIARRVTAFTAGLFGLASPESSGNSEISARQILDAGVERLEGGELARERPEVRAALLEAAGDAYRGIGEFDKASRLLQEAAAIRKQGEASDPVAYGRVLMRQAVLRRDEGKYQEAANLARQAIGRFDGAAIKGDTSAAGALTDARVDLAEILRRDNQLDEAARLASAAVAELDERARGTESHISALYMLGRVQMARGELEAAEPLLRRAYDLQTKLSGEDSDETVNARNGLAELLVVRGKTDEAELLLRRNVEAVRKIYGEGSATLGIAWNNLANALSDIPEKYGEAETAYLESVRILESSLEPGHPEIANSHNNLGSLYVKMERWQDAVEQHRIGLKLRTAALGPDHPNTTASRVGLALAMNKLGQSAEAEAMLRQAKASFTKSLGPGHWRTANAQYQLGIVLRDRGKLAEALAEVKPAQAILLAELGPEHPRTVAATKTLTELEAAAGGAARTGR